MSAACPVCESDAVDVRGPYRAAHATFAGLQRAHCRSCGMVFAALMPSEADLAAYNASYFESAHGGKSQDVVTNAFFAAIARLRASHLERYLAVGRIEVGRVLEFGPGTGFFARNWMEGHPRTQYFAAETDASCHESLRGLGVRLFLPADLDRLTEAVDLVVMSHVLEHVANPIRFLADATRSLRSGGALFIEVPCRDWEHKAINEPHLLFFDKQPMRTLLERSGFDAIEVTYHGQSIDRLRSRSALRDKLLALRSRLIALGMVMPFGRVRPGMEALSSPLERAAVATFGAHRESAEPAWWLRAVARKK